MATQQDIMKSFVNSLDKTNLRGVAAVDEALKAGSNFDSYDDLLNSFLSDRRKAASADAFLKDYCGINLDNDDTGAITGYDAGGTTVKTAESIVPEVYPDESIYPSGTSFSYKGLTVKVPEKSTLNETQQKIIAGLYTWWVRGGVELVAETYGISFSDSDATFKEITVDFNGESQYSYMSNYITYSYYPSSGETVNMAWHINSDRFTSLNSSDQNGAGDFLSEDTYLDRIIARAISRSLMMSQINYEYELPAIVGRGISYVVEGSDDRLKDEITEIANDFDKMLLFSTYNERLDAGINKATDKQDNAMGFMLMRYFAKQTADPTVTSVSATTSEQTVTEYIVDGALNSNVVNIYNGNVYYINDNNGTIIIDSNVEGDVINNTTVDNSTTIIKEGNTYTYSGGDKVIDNYQQGEVVELASDYQGIDLNGNSFFVKSSSGQVEIQNSRDKFIGYSANSEMVAYSYVASSGGTVNGRGKTQAEIMIGADNANNQIYAGSGGSSLWGGAGGNDMMFGGAGYDEFFYAVGGGSDVIQNADDNDLVNLASVNLSQISGVDVSVGQVNINFVDGGSLQVQGSSSVAYRIAEGTFKVNQSTKQWSAK